MSNDPNTLVPVCVGRMVQLEEFMKEAHVTHAHDDDVRLTTLAHCSG